MRSIAALIGLAGCLLAPVVLADVPPPPRAEPTVVVLTGDAQGSGVYIGEGVFVTAAHVVGGDTLPDIELSDGRKLIGHVIFVDHRADIAFIEAQKVVDIDAAKLACRQAMLGEEVMVRGTPVGVRFISTWGRIAGQPRSLGDWQTVIPVNISAAPGNSGGPMFDAQGKVLGILVGIGRSSGATFISLSVPSLSVCKARTYLGVM